MSGRRPSASHPVSWAKPVKARPWLNRCLLILVQVSSTASLLRPAFFAPDAEAVKRLVQELRPTVTEILIQNHRTNLTRAAAQALPSEIKVQPVEAPPDGRKRR